jgi:fido (protein-threonine AMPylation protein)/transcriptional regulator with XRE-family HTH domain
MKYLVNMKTLIKNRRKELQLKINELAAKLHIDATLLSRFESGQRIPTKTQVIQLAQALEIPQQELIQLWMRDRILAEYGSETGLDKALMMVHEVVTSYENANHPIVLPKSLQRRVDRLGEMLISIRDKRHLLHPKTWNSLMTEYTFESNRIEGNTLTLQETDLVIAHGLTISGKSMREHLEAINHHDAIAFVKELATSPNAIAEREIMQIHNLVLRGIDPHEAGRLRRHAVDISGSSHTPPQPEHLRDEMDAFMKWYHANFNSYHPVLMAADMHEKFVTMHPFIDGNGRTSRLLMNLHLMQHGYPVATIKGDLKSRMSYYKALDFARQKPDQHAFRKLVVDYVGKSCEKWLSLMK